MTAQNDDEANYTCVVTNGAGDSVMSDAASLIVGEYRRERERGRQKCVLVQYVHVLVIRVNNNLLQKYKVATCTSLCSHSFHALFFSQHMHVELCTTFSLCVCASTLQVHCM